MLIRVTIDFTGKISGALGVAYPITDRRTIEVSNEFTMQEAKEAARVALYERDETGVAYQSVSVKSLAFN